MHTACCSYVVTAKDQCIAALFSASEDARLPRSSSTKVTADASHDQHDEDSSAKVAIKIQDAVPRKVIPVIPPLLPPPMSSRTTLPSSTAASSVYGGAAVLSPSRRLVQQNIGRGRSGGITGIACLEDGILNRYGGLSMRSACVGRDLQEAAPKLDNVASVPYSSQLSCS